MTPPRHASRSIRGAAGWDHPQFVEALDQRRWMGCAQDQNQRFGILEPLGV
jgi:hypothetical protein